MKPQAILKAGIFQYQKTRLGTIGENADVNILSDLRGNKKKIFIGKKSTICKYAALEVDTTDISESTIIIGDDTLISSFAIVRTYGGTIKIGNNCFVNSFTVLYGHGNLMIGNNVLIGPQVTIVPVNHGFRDRNTPFKQQIPSLKGITIEDDVWIGAGVTILDGCIIGKGSVIGAGAVLSKSVEPYSIVAGALATKIGERV